MSFLRAGLQTYTKSWCPSSIAQPLGWLNMRKPGGKENADNSYLDTSQRLGNSLISLGLLKFVSAKIILKQFQEFWHKYLWTQYQWRCCCWVHEAPLPSIRHLRQTVHWDGHPNKSCVKIWNPKAPTDFHVWKNSARVKRGPFPFLLQPGCRTWWLPWSHSRALTHAPWAANQHGLATNYALEDKGPRKCVFNVQQ